MKTLKLLSSLIIVLCVSFIFTGQQAYASNWDYILNFLQSDGRWCHGTPWNSGQMPKINSWRASGCCIAGIPPNPDYIVNFLRKRYNSNLDSIVNFLQNDGKWCHGTPWNSGQMPKINSWRAWGYIAGIPPNPDYIVNFLRERYNSNLDSIVNFLQNDMGYNHELVIAVIATNIATNFERSNYVYSIVNFLQNDLVFNNFRENQQIKNLPQ